MPDGFTVSTNLPDFRRQLEALGEKFERRSVARAVRAAAAVYRDAAKARAPILAASSKRRVAGALKRSIYVGRSRSRQRGEVSFFVGVRGKRVSKRTGRVTDAFYWRFLEGGWMPRGPGKRIRGGRRKATLARSRAARGGASQISYPYLAPAFREKSTQALAAFNAVMEAELAAAARAQ